MTGREDAPAGATRPDAQALDEALAYFRANPGSVYLCDAVAADDEEGAHAAAIVRAAVAAGPDEPRPARGGAVEAWVKRHRDHYEGAGAEHTACWDAIDGMLDDLRDRSDIGASWSDQLDYSGMGPRVVGVSGPAAALAGARPADPRHEVDDE